jgi:hypothetical protein
VGKKAVEDEVSDIIKVWKELFYDVLKDYEFESIDKQTAMKNLKKKGLEEKLKELNEER